MRLSGLNEFLQHLFITRALITLPIVLGIPLFMSGLGHAFFNPSKEVAIGILELVASAFLFLGAPLSYCEYKTSAIVCYSISAICVVITVVMHVAILIRQVRN